MPDGSDVDLRNPAQVRAMLARIGFDVPDTRSWRLEPFRGRAPGHRGAAPWRKSERITTTYGYSWLDRHVGLDGRLRGAWRGCDGAGGRMTAQAGLHNMPADLRPAVVAEPGHVFVRADLGQIEPRVLAAVSGDEALARATADPDLYSPVAARLGCERPIAKVAVLAAMYGQTSGAAGEALRGLDRAYPVAMAYLRAADESGKRGERRHDIRRPADPDVVASPSRWTRRRPHPEVVSRATRSCRARRPSCSRCGRSRCARAWRRTPIRPADPQRSCSACTTSCWCTSRSSTLPPYTNCVLHALEQTAARWATGSGVRLVADVSVVRRWSDAK